MSLINASNLTFGYEGSYDLVFDGVSFRLDTDWRLGLTGRNGRGKTTLLRLLLGELDGGGAISASVQFEYFPPRVADENLTAFAVAEALTPGLALWALERELSLLGLEPEILEQPFGLMSYGERTKVLLAALFLRDNAFLLIDEPTNHLDLAGRELVCAYLRRKSGFILVSHDRAFLDGCVDHIMDIGRQEIQIQQGNFSSWWENKAREDAHEMAENDRLRKDVKRLKGAARQAAQWSDKTESSKIGSHSADRGFVGAQAARMMKRSKAIARRRDTAATEKAALLKNIETAETLKLHPLPYHKKQLLSLRDVALSYGERTIVRGIGFAVETGDRVALRGPNGSGKSSVLKLLTVGDGALTVSGTVTLGSGLIISHVSQSADGLSGRLRDYAEANSVDESLLLAILRKLDFSRVQFEKDISELSQGQKKKVLLARSLCESAHLYVWDEPLNYIDVLSRMQIEQLILDFEPTLLFVEHDRVFCDRVATKTVVL